MVLLIAFILVVVTILGDYYLKLGSAKAELLNFEVTVGMMLFALTGLGWAWVMRYKSLDQVAVLYSGGSLILLACLGWFIFSEPMTARKLIGVCFAVIAIWLIGE